MKKQSIFIGVIFLFLSCGDKKQQHQNETDNLPTEQISSRYVKDNILISNELPEIKIKVNEESSFAGKFDFEIIANSGEYSEKVQGKPVAAGERYVFASADENHSVKKLFIVQ